MTSPLILFVPLSIDRNNGPSSLRPWSSPSPGGPSWPGPGESGETIVGRRATAVVVPVRSVPSDGGAILLGAELLRRRLGSPSTLRVKDWSQLDRFPRRSCLGSVRCERGWACLWPRGGATRATDLLTALSRATIDDQGDVRHPHPRCLSLVTSLARNRIQCANDLCSLSKLKSQVSWAAPGGAHRPVAAPPPLASLATQLGARRSALGAQRSALTRDAARTPLIGRINKQPPLRMI